MQSIGAAIKNRAATASKFPNQVRINIMYLLILCAYKSYSLGLDILSVCECGKLV